MFTPGRNGSRFSVVPWYNRHEWEKVYQNLFSSSWEDQAAGLASVAVWRSRLYGRLPPAIEATAALVRARLNDIVTLDAAFAVDGMSADELSSLFAVAIVRFVGDIVEPQRSAKNISAKEAAFQLGVPDWVLDLRHASAHGSTCGGRASLGVLRTAASLLLEWLRSNHWEAQRDSLAEAPSSTGAAVHRVTPVGSDDGGGQPSCCTPAKVRHVLDSWLLASAKKQRRGVPAREMAAREERKRVCLKQLAAFVDEDSDLVVDTLVMGGDYLLPSREALEALCPNLKLTLPAPKDGVPCQLPRLLVCCWDPLLTTLKPHVLQQLAERLLTQPQSRRGAEDERLRRYLCVAWVSHLLAGGRPGLQPGRYDSGCIGESSHKMLNVTRLLRAALDNPMEYSAKVVTLVARHMWPPLNEHDIGLLTALAAIHTGLMVDDDNSADDSSSEEQEPEEQPSGRGGYIPFTVEDFQGAENDSKEAAWALPRTPMDWSSTPIGALPGFPADKVDLTLHFKELRPAGALRPQQARIGTVQEAMEASEGDLDAEELEQLPPPDQMEYISQNVHMFVM